MEEVVERFLKYAAIDTSSSELTGNHPSTDWQRDLADVLVDELKSAGIPDEDIFYDVEHCYIYCKIRGREDLPAIGFISHMDTSPETSGTCVKPRIIEDYDGKDIELGHGKVLSPSDFPELLQYAGQTVITASGDTLLGSDDKAGIAEIMTMASYVISHPELVHGGICIAFTPDEEIGEGTMFFDIERFGADFAYTVDGGVIGELSYENFNAATATVTVEGRNVHPGEAYGKMINSQRLAMEIDGSLPPDARPEVTCDYEGFFHLIEMRGNCDSTVMKYLIRDHSRELFEDKKRLLRDVCARVESAHPGSNVSIDITDSYYNMREVIVPDNMHIVNRCVAAMERAMINPLIRPIRGGTDGAMLSFKGLPCPNICAGGHNFHGIYEFVTAESMSRIANLLVELVKP